MPIINRSSGKIIGVVNEGDLFKLYLSTQSKIVDLEKSNWNNQSGKAGFCQA